MEDFREREEQRVFEHWYERSQESAIPINPDGTIMSEEEDED